MLKGKVKQKRTEENKDEFFGADFYVRKVKGEKDEQGISKNSSKLKRIMSHSFVKKKKRTEKERQMTEREKAEDVFSNLLDEEQHFVRYITTGKQKMRKLEKPFFKTQKNKTKQQK